MTIDDILSESVLRHATYGEVAVRRLDIAKMKLGTSSELMVVEHGTSRSPFLRLVVGNAVRPVVDVQAIRATTADHSEIIGAIALFTDSVPTVWQDIGNTFEYRKSSASEADNAHCIVFASTAGFEKLQELDWDWSAMARFQIANRESSDPSLEAEVSKVWENETPAVPMSDPGMVRFAIGRDEAGQDVCLLVNFGSTRFPIVHPAESSSNRAV